MFAGVRGSVRQAGRGTDCRSGERGGEKFVVFTFVGERSTEERRSENRGEE